MLERAFQTRLINHLKGKAYVFNIHGHAEQRAGVPDLHITSPIWTGYVELKTRKNECSPKQQLEIRRINCHGSAIVMTDDGFLEDEEGHWQGNWNWESLLQDLRIATLQ